MNIAISEDERLCFIEQLQLPFEKLEEKSITLSIADCKKLGITLVCVKHPVVPTTLPVSKIAENEILFYSKNEIHQFFHLLRHFRNSAAHPDRIFRVKKTTGRYYYFIDTVNNNGVKKLTMSGLINIEIWNEFIQTIYSLVLNDPFYECPMQNDSIKQKINLNKILKIKK